VAKASNPAIFHIGISPYFLLTVKNAGFMETWMCAEKIPAKKNREKTDDYRDMITSGVPPHHLSALKGSSAEPQLFIP